MRGDDSRDEAAHFVSGAIAAVLHQDQEVMPRRKVVWFRGTTSAAPGATAHPRFV